MGRLCDPWDLCFVGRRGLLLYFRHMLVLRPLQYLVFEADSSRSTPQPRRRDLLVQVDAVSTNPVGSHSSQHGQMGLVTDHSLGLEAVLACP